MRAIIKDLVPDSILKRLRARLVLRNRMRISKECERQSVVHLQPVNRVEHYFHFVLDLCLPLWHLIKATDDRTTFVVQEFGIFTERLKVLFPNRVEIEYDAAKWNKADALPMLGMNPQFLKIQPQELASFKQHVDRTLGIDPNISNDKVLLIERMPPNQYFQNEAVKKGAGASRRSIPNHSELQSEIEAVVKPGFEFCNIQLENIGFEEQIRLFDQAALVIGQHGAGLANCVWMRPRSSVLELSHKLSLKHFHAICVVKNLSYTVLQTDGPHVEIDTRHVMSTLATDRKLNDAIQLN